jgi:hypothetical protein
MAGMIPFGTNEVMVRTSSRISTPTYPPVSGGIINGIGKKRTAEYRTANIECRGEDFLVLRFLVRYSIFNSLVLPSPGGRGKGRGESRT